MQIDSVVRKATSAEDDYMPQPGAKGHLKVRQQVVRVLGKSPVDPTARGRLSHVPLLDAAGKS